MDILGHITFQIGILSSTTRTKILLNGGIGLSNTGPIWSGVPANCLLLCLSMCSTLLNHKVYAALDGKIPLFTLTGITPDISIILLFTFNQSC